MTTANPLLADTSIFLKSVKSLSSDVEILTMSGRVSDDQRTQSIRLENLQYVDYVLQAAASMLEIDDLHVSCVLVCL